MRVLVVFESMMGNTRVVAEAIAQRLTDVPGIDVECTAAAELLELGRQGDEGPLPAPDADLLVVGTPTHFLGMPGSRSRRLWVEGREWADGRDRGVRPRVALEPSATNPGVREWVDQLPNVPGMLAATFDTRLDKPLSGGAAPRIARRLRAKGCTLVADPEGFAVTDMEGPLRRGELEHARSWAVELVSHAVV